MIVGLIIDILIVAIILATAIRGYHKGLTTLIFGFLCTVVAVIVALIFFKPISNVVIEKTSIDEFFEDVIYGVLENENIKNGQVIDPTNTDMSEQFVGMINKFLSEGLEKAVDNVVSYVSVKLSHLMVNLIVFILIIVILRFAFGFLEFFVDILASLPIIKQLNRVGGTVAGLIKGFLIVYVILAIFSIFSPVFMKTGVLGMVQDSKIGSTLYNNNLIFIITSKGI